MDVETFMNKIGGDCYEYADQFEKVEDIFTVSSYHMKKELGIATH